MECWFKRVPFQAHFHTDLGVLLKMVEFFLRPPEENPIMEYLENHDADPNPRSGLSPQAKSGTAFNMLES